MRYEVLGPDSIEQARQKAALAVVTACTDAVYEVLGPYLRRCVTVRDLNLGRAEFPTGVLRGIAIGLKITGVQVRFHQPASGDVLNSFADIELYEPV